MQHPERNGDDNTPRKTRNLRRHAQWAMQNDIEERKSKRRRTNPKRKLKLTDDNKATYAFAQPAEEQRTIHQPTALREKFVPFSLGVKKIETKQSVKFNIFTETNPEAIEKDTKKTAESHAIEIPSIGNTTTQFNLFSQPQLNLKRSLKLTPTMTEIEFSKSRR